MSPVSSWSEPPDSCVLGAGEVQFRNDERRFIVARGVLRAILASYLGLAPSAFRFSFGIHGKPELEPPAFPDAPRRPDIAFNVSHSGELALYAIARGRQVGIDIERMDVNTDIEALARRFLSEVERSHLGSLEDGRRPAAFYRAWARKEAYLKARGVGLSLPLDSFDVSLRPGEPAGLLARREPGAAVSDWTLMELPAGPDYAAALAVEGTPRTVRLWRWGETTAGRSDRRRGRDRP